MLDILLAFDPLMLLAFIGAGLVLNFTPGADFVFISASGIAGGPRRGFAAAIGVNLGIAVHVLAAAGGVSALLIAYPGAYQSIKIAGAAYLLWLAWSAWRSDGALAEGRADATAWRTVRRGFLVNVLNPKTALFIFAFIPQFTDPAIGPLWAQILILGAIFLLNGFVFALCLGGLAGLMANVLRPRVRMLNRFTSILFAGLAARLLTD